jgi:hypothetical protein
MSAQMTIDQAIAAGEQAMQACTDKAQSLGFSTDAAKTFVLGWLAEYGPTPGEDLVDAAERTGRPDLIAHDARAWGGVFASLSGRRIHCLRSDLPRKRGHGTSGGKLWAILQ